MDDLIFEERKCEGLDVKLNKFYDTPDCSKKFETRSLRREKYFHNNKFIKQWESYGVAYKDSVESYKENNAKLEKLLREIPEQLEDENYYVTSFVRLKQKEEVFASKNPIFVSAFDSAEEVIAMNLPQLNIDFEDAKYFIRRAKDRKYPNYSNPVTRSVSERSESDERFDVFKIPYIQNVGDGNLHEAAQLAKKYGKIIVGEVRNSLIYDKRTYYGYGYQNDTSSIVKNEPLIIRRSCSGAGIFVFYSEKDHTQAISDMEKALERREKRTAKKASPEKSVKAPNITAKGLTDWNEILVSNWLSLNNIPIKNVKLRYSTCYPRTKDKKSMEEHISKIMDHLEGSFKNISNFHLSQMIKDVRMEYIIKNNVPAIYSTLNAINVDVKKTLKDRKNCIRVFKFLTKVLKESKTK